MNNCLSCEHFSFTFSETMEYSEVTIDVGEFQIACMERHFNRDSEETNETDLHNLLLCGGTCRDFKRSELICKSCGKRRESWQPHCPTCK